MKPERNSNNSESPLGLAALRRAAKDALDLARRTGTPCYVMENGKIVDIAKRPAQKSKRRPNK